MKLIRLQRVRPSLRKMIFAKLLLAFFVCPFVAQAQKKSSKEFVEADSLMKVSRIEVQGNKRIEKDAILEKMSIKALKSFDQQDVSRVVKEIFSLGFFEDVQLQIDGDLLTVVVRERPIISKISFTGSDEFEDKELTDISGIKVFNVMSLAKIRAGQKALEKKYEEKGFYLAQADFELLKVPGRPSEVELQFKIFENQRVRIRRIFFLGNKVFTSADLKQAMATTEGHMFSWASGGGTYREANFERDLSLLAYFYANEGYIEAKFAKPRVTLSQDRRYVDVFIDVEEGKQYFLGDVRFEGAQDLLFSEENLRQSFKMASKDVFSAGKLQEEVLSLTDKYGDEGYAFANVVPKTAIRPGTQIVDLTFDIEKGELVYWGRIQVIGNDKTHDKVVRRELRFSEGELYNATKRKKSLERIRRTGYFGDVNFLTSAPKGSNNILDLDVKVTEKLTGSLNVAAGYGSGSGPQFSASISQFNLFGRGQQLAFDLQIQKNAENFNLRFTDPAAFDTEWLMGFDVYYRTNRVGDNNSYSYKQDLLGTNLRVGREIYEDFNLYGTYKLEKYRLSDAINRKIFTDPDKDQRGIISSIATNLEYDTRNNRLDPSAGWYWSASSEFAGLGGRVFQKYLAEVRFYHRLFWKVVYRSNYQYGLLTNSLNGESVPDSERFTLGGVHPYPLRGYRDGSVGTYKYVTNARLSPKHKDAKKEFPYVIGGTQRFLINQELEFPLIPEADIRATVFFDSGNAWSGDLTESQSPALLSSYGWGIRWYSPLGPLRFEWGFPLSTTGLKKNKSSEFHFIIAPTF